MCILTQENPQKIVINLGGPQGNAWYLLGLVREFCKITGEDPQPIIDEMNAGDYENLLRIFEEHFEKFINLDR